MAADDLAAVRTFPRLNVYQFAVVRNDDAVLFWPQITALELCIYMRIFPRSTRGTFGLNFLDAPSLATIHFAFSHAGVCPSVVIICDMIPTRVERVDLNAYSICIYPQFSVPERVMSRDSRLIWIDL